MLDRLLEQRNAVSLVLTTTTVVKNLSAQQWATASDLTATLRPFIEVTEEMSAASYPMMSMIIPIVDSLQHLLRATQGGLDMLRNVMTGFLRDKFGDLFADDELCAATLVNPRFKMLPFDSHTRHCKAMDATLALMSAVRDTSSAPSSSISPNAAAAPTVEHVISSV